MRDPEIHINDEVMRRITAESIKHASVVVERPEHWGRWRASLRISGKNLFKDLTIAHGTASTKKEAENIGAVLRDLCLMRKGVD